MAADDMSDIEIQGGSWLHTRYAQAAIIQGLYVSGSTERGRGSAQPKRCMLLSTVRLDSTDRFRTSNQPTKWKKRNAQRSRPSCKN
jgi:hypothetical protein